LRFFLLLAESVLPVFAEVVVEAVGSVAGVVAAGSVLGLVTPPLGSVAGAGFTAGSVVVLVVPTGGVGAGVVVGAVCAVAAPLINSAAHAIRVVRISLSS
jgi:hypothetical protein